MPPRSARRWSGVVTMLTAVLAAVGATALLMPLLLFSAEQPKRCVHGSCMYDDSQASELADHRFLVYTYGKVGFLLR